MIIDATCSGMIPKIIHFMWLDRKSMNNDTLPTKYLSKVQKWKELNPDFTIRLWFNQQMDDLASALPAPMLNFYNSFDPNSHEQWMAKCDYAKCLIVWSFGGLFSDLDFYAIKPIAPLLESAADIFLVKEIKEHEYYGLPQLCYGFYAASPKHDFFESWLAYCPQNYDPTKDNVENGPILFYKFWEQFNPQPILSDTCTVLAYTDKQQLAHQCMDAQNIYAYTLWVEGSTTINEKFTDVNSSPQDNQHISGFIHPIYHFIKREYILLLLFLLLIFLLL